MRSRVPLLMCAFAAVVELASAQSIALNGVAAPAGVTVGAATSVTLGVADSAGQPSDYLALFAIGAPDSQPLAWCYLNGTKTAPGTGLTTATVTQLAPGAAGTYEWRLFTNSTRLATSGPVTVTASTAVVTVNGVAAPNAVSVVAGGTVVATVADGPGNTTDLVTLAPAGSSNGTILDWRYLNNTTVAPNTAASGGTVTFVAPATPGAYEVRFFAANLAVRLATGGALSVTASPAALAVNGVAPPTAVPANAGTYVTVDVTDGPGNPGDWVGLYAVSSPDAAPLVTRYLNGSGTPPVSGLTAATVSFAVPATAGSYEFRFFSTSSYTRLATSTSLVVAAPTAQLGVNGVAAPAPATALPGTQAVVSVAAGPGNLRDFVGLYEAGSTDDAVLDWRYLNDTGTAPTSALTTGTLHFSVPTTPGTYEFRFFMDDTFERLATSGPLVVPQTPAEIAINGAAPSASVSVAPGATITASITGGPGNTSDWVALAVQGAANGSHLAWQYVNGSTVPPTTGLTAGTVNFTLPAGSATYEVRLYASGTNQRVVTSAPIVASTAPPVVAIAITSPFPGTTYNAPAELAVAAAVTINGGVMQRVDFYDGNSLIGVATATPYVVTWTAPGEGLHTLTSVAVDQTGATTTSAPVTVTIASGGVTLGTLGAPIITPEGGAFGLPQTVSMAAAEGATIHFTLDGSTPTASSPAYAGPFTLTESTAVKAVAVGAGWSQSGTSYAYLHIDSVAPTVVSMTPFSEAQNVRIGSGISVAFSELMEVSSITAAAFELRTAGGTVVPALVWYDDSAATAILQPTAPLALAATYAMTVKGGTDSSAAKDLMGNQVANPLTWNFTTQTSVLSPTLSIASEIHVRNDTLVTLSAEDNDPQGLPLTYLWTQLAGPAVVLRGASTPIPSFVTPDTDALLRFRATVSNGFISAYAETDVYVRQFTTAFGISIRVAEGHTSDVSATAPTLAHSHIFDRLSETLSIQLGSVTGRVLQPTQASPLNVSVSGDERSTDITHLFTYSPSTNTVDLNLGAADALRQAIGDGLAELSLSAPDSDGDDVHISIPILRAVTRITGLAELVQGGGVIVGGSVQLADAAGAFRASAIVDSSGAFAIENVPAGNYAITLDAPGGLSGRADVTVPSFVSTGNLDVTIDARSTAGLEPRQWPCDSIFPNTYYGSPTTCTEEYLVVVPRGSVQLSVKMVAHQPNVGFPGAGTEQCSGLAAWGLAYQHGHSTVRLYLDGQPLASQSMPHCAMGYQQVVSESTLNISSLARDRDLIIRGLRTNTSDASPYAIYGHAGPFAGGLNGEVGWQSAPHLVITSITDRVGNAAPTLFEHTAQGNAVDKLIGIPFDDCGTFQGEVVPGQGRCHSTPSPGVNDHRWRLRVNYSPANAQITAVRALVVGPGLHEPLVFDQATALDGHVDLTNVRFPEFQPHILWHAKYNRVSLVVEIDGVIQGQTATTATGELGVGSDHGPWLLTALYDAGRMPGADGRRFGPLTRDETRGGDGWGRERTLGFLQNNPDLRFNDLSLEHGGPFHPDHRGHRTGLEIDVRYFGTGGDANLNGQQNDEDLGTHRLGVLTAAQGHSGDPSAQRAIVAWIRQNRQRISSLAADPLVRQVLIGRAEWNQRSLKQGRYPDGSQILDPDLPPGEAWIGAWDHPKVGHEDKHLSHVHIDLVRKP